MKYYLINEPNSKRNSPVNSNSSCNYTNIIFNIYLNTKIMTDNELIAEFMGLDSFKDSLASLHQGKINVDVDVYEQAQYHTSWDWLMPVVGKIEQTPNVYDIEEFLLIRDELCTARIETIYDSVVEFIKWYNENK